MSNSANNQDIQILKDSGFKIKEYTLYHFNINGKLDIWPTYKRYFYLPTKEKGEYEDIIGLAERLLSPPTQQTKVVFTRDPEDFEKETNQLTCQGWKISSTSCNNEFRAVLIKGGQNNGQ